MTEPHEPSYYEIALTHRQVLVAFVVLLVSLIVAFFAGVWVGKGGVGAVPTVEAAKPAPAPDAQLEEFRFFSESERRPSVAAPRPGTTLAEELGAADRPAAATPAPPLPEDEAEAAEDAGGPPAERVVAAPAPTSPAPAAVEGGLVVQVFSSPDGAQAQRILQRLLQGGFQAFLSPVQVGAQTMHRVRIGPFAERTDAQRVADQVRQRFKLDTWITR